MSTKTVGIAFAEPAAKTPEARSGPVKVKGPKDSEPSLTFVTRRLLLTVIKRDAAFMMRVKLDQESVSEYAEKYRREKDGKMEEGEKAFPLPECVELPDGSIVLVHGWHRFAGMDRAELRESDFLVAKGSREQAAKHAAKANLTATTVQYRNIDKKNACIKLFAILGNVASNLVAKLAGVSPKTAEVHRPKPKDGEDAKRLGADGKLRAPPARPTVENPKLKTEEPTDVSGSSPAEAPKSVTPTPEVEPAKATATPPSVSTNPPVEVVPTNSPPVATNAASSPISVSPVVPSAPTSPRASDKSKGDELVSPDLALGDQGFDLEGDGVFRFAVGGEKVEMQILGLLDGRVKGQLRLV